MQVAHDHARQALVVHEEALADRVGVLFGDLDRLFQDLVSGATPRSTKRSTKPTQFSTICACSLR